MLQISFVSIFSVNVYTMAVRFDRAINYGASTNDFMSVLKCWNETTMHCFILKRNWANTSLLWRSKAIKISGSIKFPWKKCSDVFYLMCLSLFANSTKQKIFIRRMSSSTAKEICVYCIQKFTKSLKIQKSLTFFRMNFDAKWIYSQKYWKKYRFYSNA